jgi:hypothetical protein
VAPYGVKRRRPSFFFFFIRGALALGLKTTWFVLFLFFETKKKDGDEREA